MICKYKYIIGTHIVYYLYYCNRRNGVVTSQYIVYETQEAEKEEENAVLRLDCLRLLLFIITIDTIALYYYH